MMMVLVVVVVFRLAWQASGGLFLFQFIICLFKYKNTMLSPYRR